jgi:hypothetical protein
LADFLVFEIWLSAPVMSPFPPQVIKKALARKHLRGEAEIALKVGAVRLITRGCVSPSVRI